MQRRSSTGPIAVEWRNRKIDRFTHYFLEPEVLFACRQWHESVPSTVAKKFLETVVPLSEAKTVVRIVLPYRTEWKGIARLLSTMCRGLLNCVEAETGLRIELAVSWSRAGPSLVSLLGFRDAEDRSGGRR